MDALVIARDGGEVEILDVVETEGEDGDGEESAKGDIDGACLVASA